MITSRSSRRVTAVATALLTSVALLIPLSAAAIETEDTPAALPNNPCDVQVEAALEAVDITPDTAYNFVCTPTEVSLAVQDGSGEIGNFSVPAEDLPALPPSSLIEPFAAGDMCYIQDPVTRTIVSELQVDIDFCIIYGQNNHPTNGSWARSAKVDWRIYPGWPSEQNVLRIGSSFADTGDVWMFGTLTLQKQNGALWPIDISATTLDLRSGYPSIAFYLGNITEYGSHAVRLDDFEITDFDYQFSAQVSNPTVYTPRFHCEPENERCYYPNGEEAGL